MTQLRLYSPDDYPALASWWAGHGWHSVPANILPKLGVIAHSDEQDLAAGFLYMDNSVGVCWLEWLVSNPDAEPRDTLRALRAAICFLKERARELDYGIMMTTCRQPGLVRLLERQGFKVTDSDVTHLLQVL